MTITRPLLVSRDEVAAAVDIAYTARMTRQIDRAATSGTEAVEQLCHRTFHPTYAERVFDWPSGSYSAPWELWIDETGDELIELTSFTAGGVVIPTADLLLCPPNSGPPYTSIQVDTSTASALQSGDTDQQAIAAVGAWGYRNDRSEVGALTGAMGMSGSAGLTLSPTVGAGALLFIDDEGLLVTDKTMVDTTQNLGGPGLAAQVSDRTVPVTDGTAFEPDEVLLIGSERMEVTDVVGNNLTVRRALAGNDLAAHAAGADIYALAGFTVLRGQVGTTAATHLSGTAIYRWDPPTAPRDLALAEAINQLEQEGSAYARTVGAGENARESRGAGLADKRKAVWRSHARKGRQMAV